MYDKCLRQHGTYGIPGRTAFVLLVLDATKIYTHTSTCLVFSTETSLSPELNLSHLDQTAHDSTHGATYGRGEA
jgi:hypothetical protein